MRSLAPITLSLLLGACPSTPNVDPGATTEAATEDSTAADSTGSQSMTAEPPDGGSIPTFPMCECTLDGEVLDPMPDACEDLEVPPMEEPGPRYSGWLTGPSTIMASTLAVYYCQDPDLSGANIECPCSNFSSLRRYDFAAPPLEVGEVTAALATAEAYCADVCNAQGSESDPASYDEFPIQVLAVSDTCIILETMHPNFNERVYVDRQACG